MPCDYYFPPQEPDWDSITLADDFFFGYVMQDESICKEFLEILLNKRISELHHIRQQDKIKLSPSRRAVYLDVKLYADNRVINIEMQTTKKQDLPLRIRYYQSTTDSRLLPKGTPYENLPTLLTIFICTFDFFSKGLPLYTICNTVKELDNKEFQDKRYILLYNTKAYQKAKNPAQRDLLSLISGGKPKSEKGKIFAKSVQILREEEKFKEAYMDYYLKENEIWTDARLDGYETGRAEGRAAGRSEGIAEGRAKGIAEGRAEGRAEGKMETAKTLLAMNLLSPNEISIATGISLEEIQKLAGAN